VTGTHRAAPQRIRNTLGIWLALGGSLLAGIALAQEQPAAEQPPAAAAQPAGAPQATGVGSVEAGRTKSVTCAACHGADGNSVSPEWPTLAGQHANYIIRQLKAFKAGERNDVTMKPFALMLSDQDMLDLAAYFSTQTPTPKGADPALVSLGQQIYRRGVPDRGVTACIGCHGPTGHGNPLASFPRISNQHAAYVTKTLGQYAAGERKSDVDKNQMMRNVAGLLLDDEVKAVASYVQGLH
jgi:cytochrome c553